MFVIAVALIVGLGSVSFLLSVPLSRRIGQKSIFELSTRKKLILLATYLVTTVVVIFAASEMLHGQPALGIAALVVLFVLPSLVTTPLTVRRARRRAAEARAHRTRSR